MCVLYVVLLLCTLGYYCMCTCVYLHVDIGYVGIGVGMGIMYVSMCSYKLCMLITAWIL